MTGIGTKASNLRHTILATASAKAGISKSGRGGAAGPQRKGLLLFRKPRKQLRNAAAFNLLEAMALLDGAKDSAVLAEKQMKSIIHNAIAAHAV